MLWLFTQMFLLCAGSFLAGSLLAWLPMRAVVRRLRAELAASRRPVAALAAPAVVVVPEPRAEAGLDEESEVDFPESGHEDFAPESESEADLPVKGNSKSRIFHTEASPYYRRMKGDVRFRSAEEAERAGYTAWSPRTRSQLAGSAQ
ncbi:hypothetical protein [Umezawaea sp. Da 62-37]|uniref:sunset domain-containing protein n=1 Tax=Umezawaea sp. Da 62-37 TaxID=3075927 RepID=UPI0028F73E3F|nr:hypothetical protein [Umezawaea sp. Da 62-37]WNV89207.1 hypothetical protein RM788_13160 [Umezawaea sp. Da 62-37]